MLTVGAAASTLAARPAHDIHKACVDQLGIIAIGLRVLAEAEKCAKDRIRAIVIPGSFGNVAQCRGMSGRVVGCASICGSVGEIVKVGAADSPGVGGRG